MPRYNVGIQGQYPAQMGNPFKRPPFSDAPPPWYEQAKSVPQMQFAGEMGEYGSPVGSAEPQVAQSPILRALMQSPEMGAMEIPGLGPQVSDLVQRGDPGQPTPLGDLPQTSEARLLADVPGAPAIDPRTMFRSALNLPQPGPTETEQLIEELAQQLPPENDSRPWIRTMGGMQRDMSGPPEEGFISSTGQWLRGSKPEVDPQAALTADFNMREKGFQYDEGLGWHPPKSQGDVSSPILSALGQEGGGVRTPVFERTGVLPLADRQRNRAAQGIERGMVRRGHNPRVALAMSQQMAGGEPQQNSRYLNSILMGPMAAEFERIDAMKSAAEQQLGLAQQQMQMAERMGNAQLASTAASEANRLQVTLAGLAQQQNMHYATLTARMAELAQQGRNAQAGFASNEKIAGIENSGANQRAWMNLFGNMAQSQQANALKKQELEIMDKEAGFKDPNILAGIAAKNPAFAGIDPAQAMQQRVQQQITPEIGQQLIKYYDSEDWDRWFTNDNIGYIASQAAVSPDLAAFKLDPLVIAQYYQMLGLK